MCYQVVERYAVCRCLYHKHAIDPCAQYGQYGHSVQEKTVLVGYACSVHASRSAALSTSSFSHSFCSDFTSSELYASPADNDGDFLNDFNILTHAAPAPAPAPPALPAPPTLFPDPGHASTGAAFELEPELSCHRYRRF